ncbi:MAG: DUF5106 domain-containing protein [Spirosomataceae bacterium]
MSKKHPYLLLTLLFSIGFLQLLAQNSLKIEARITNSEPTALVLMQHFGGHLMPVDTAFLGVDGMVVWEKKEKIPAGMCRIVGLGHGLDIFVSDSQVFSFEANLKDIVRTIEFKNSDDNTLFFNYQREIRRRYQPLLTYRQQEGIKDNNDPRWQSRFQELNENIKKYVDSLYKKQPQSLATHFLKSYQEPKLPILPLQQLTAKDSTYLQKYAWEHYFDHTFLSDERMLYTPTFPARFERFLKIIPQIPTEDITNLIDNVIQQTKGTVEMRKYVVGQLVQKFELTPSATFDRLYQHIVDNYVDNEPNLWDASTLQKVKEVQQIKEKIAIGRTFPSLPLTDFNGKEILHSSLQSQYTVLFLTLTVLIAASSLPN